MTFLTGYIHWRCKFHDNIAVKDEETGLEIEFYGRLIGVAVMMLRFRYSCCRGCQELLGKEVGRAGGRVPIARIYL